MNNQDRTISRLYTEVYGNVHAGTEFKEKIFRLLLKRQGFSDEMLATDKSFSNFLVKLGHKRVPASIAKLITAVPTIAVGF